MSISKSRRHDCNDNYELKTDEKLFTCDGCKMKGFGTRYTCNTGRRELHRECWKPERHINHEYFGRSTLTFREKPFKKRSKGHEYSKYCDACVKDIHGFSYHCEAGKLDLHPCCATLEKKLLVDGTEFNLVSKALSQCDRCHQREISNGATKVSGWSYVSTCGKYNFHVHCMTEMEHEAFTKHGNSALEKVDSKQLTQTKRNGESEGTTFETIKPFLKIVVSVLKIVIVLLLHFICNLIWLFIGQLRKMFISKSLRHDCNDHYELKTDEKLFTCDGCKMNGLGPRYTCNPCGNELHRECKNHTTEINHEYFAGSTLTFLQKPFTRFNESSKRREYSKCCNACGKEIRGFSYHCEADKLDLHPCCRNLKKKLLIKDTAIFNLGSKVSSKCAWCEKREISDGNRKVQGWSYVCTCGKYNFHVYCMTEMEHEAFMKHGNSALEKVDLKQLTKAKRNGGSGRTTFVTKSFLQIIVSVLTGDPTLLIANVVVELLTGWKQ